MLKLVHFYVCHFTHTYAHTHKDDCAVYMINSPSRIDAHVILMYITKLPSVGLIASDVKTNLDMWNTLKKYIYSGFVFFVKLGYLNFGKSNRLF